MPIKKPTTKVRKSHKNPPVKRVGFSRLKMIQFIQGGYTSTDPKTGEKKKVGSSYGFINTVAARMGKDWHTARKYIDKYDLNDILDAEREQAAEFTTSKLMQNVAANDNTAIALAFKVFKSKRWNTEPAVTSTDKATEQSDALKPAADFLSIKPKQFDMPDISHLSNGTTDDEPAD